MYNFFLLSTEEADKLPEAIRICEAPATYNGSTDKNGKCWWWLRSPGKVTQDTCPAACVTTKGYVHEIGYNVYSRDGGIRPACAITHSDLHLSPLKKITKENGTEIIKYLGYDWINISDYIGYPCLLMEKCLPTSGRFDGCINDYPSSEIKYTLDNMRDACDTITVHKNELFLLSVGEVEKLPVAVRRCRTKNNRGSELNVNNNCKWWLRSPGYNTDYVSYVMKNGDIHIAGARSDYSAHYIRPAMRIDYAFLSALENATIETDEDGHIRYKGSTWINVSEYLGYPCLLSLYCFPQPMRFDKESNEYASSEIKTYLGLSSGDTN